MQYIFIYLKSSGTSVPGNNNVGIYERTPPQIEGWDELLFGNSRGYSGRILYAPVRGSMSLPENTFAVTRENIPALVQDRGENATGFHLRDEYRSAVRPRGRKEKAEHSTIYLP
jgi:hypothetical protein